MPKPLPSKKIIINSKDLQKLNLPTFKGLPLEERDGVYVHSFICNNCNLHFNIYSWRANKHLTKNITCPECQNTKTFRHWRWTLSENTKFHLNGNEIMKYCPHPGSNFMPDSTIKGIGK